MTTHPTPPERELVALLELSDRATAGPWAVSNYNEATFVQSREDGGANPIGFVYCPSFPERSEVGQRALADVAFIAALVNWFRSTRAATVPQGVSADVARMDWLEARGYPGQFYACDDGSPTEKWFDSETIGSDYPPTLRAAIDAAMNPPQGG